MKKFVTTELLKRKKEWKSFAEITGLSTKTIYRIANDLTDAKYSTIESLYLLLKAG